MTEMSIRRSSDPEGKPAERGPREFAYTRADFDKVRALIYKRAGIRLNDTKQEMVYSRLVRRLRDLNLPTFRDYLEFLESSDGEEWQKFINSLTTNQTGFFREPHHFPILADYLRALPSGVKPQLWSAAASTGEEAYSMAMTACDVYQSDTPPVKILACDLDTQVLQRASDGVYTVDQVRGLSPQQLRRFFLKGTGAREGMVKVTPALRALVNFTQHNLLDENWRFSDRFDCVFCRNVMIYFDRPTQYKVLDRIARVLKPVGLLFAGHSESYFHATDLFRACGRTVYRHASQASP